MKRCIYVAGWSVWSWGPDLVLSINDVGESTVMMMVVVVAVMVFVLGSVVAIDSVSKSEQNLSLGRVKSTTKSYN